MKRLRVLLIDDDTVWLGLFSRRLERQGFEITTSPTAHEAIALVEREPFDVVFCDIKITYRTESGEVVENGGLNLVQDIRETSPHAEVVVITGYGSTDLARESFRGGVFDFLEKNKQLFENMLNALARISEHRRRLITKPNILVSHEKYPHREDLAVETVKLRIDAKWTVTELIALSCAMRGIYTFLLVTEAENLPKASSCEKDYLDKLWRAIEFGLLETSANRLEIDEIHYGSPGHINFKGLGEPIEALKNLLGDLFLMVFKIQKEKADVQRLRNELAQQADDIKARRRMRNLEIAEKKLKIEERELAIIKEKIGVFELLGFSKSQICNVIDPTNRYLNNLANLIEEGKVLPPAESI